MADDLGRRIETAVEALIAAELPSEQVLRFGETEKAGKQYFIVSATRGEEDPPGTGVFAFTVEITGHGQFTQANVDSIDTIFTGSYDLATALRSEGSGEFVMPAGEACEIGPKSKTGSGIDAEYIWTFSAWAQTQQINDAA